jgi:hypothetical protein
VEEPIFGMVGEAFNECFILKKSIILNKLEIFKSFGITFALPLYQR